VSASLWLYDLGAYSLQVAVLAGSGALLARLFGLRASRATLAYWRVLLAACVVLPLCQPWRVSTPDPEAPVTAMSGAISSTLASSAVPWSFAEAAWWVIGAGVLARAAWLGLGLGALRRLRRRSGEPPAGRLPLSEAEERVGARAEVRLSPEAPVPVTFGLRRPVVLLPPAVLGMPAHAQQAILCHELLHVRRRDWLHSLAEEAVRTALWFHPAVWWLVGRIHLAREQVVDQAVIALTLSRERYVDALLEIARGRSEPRLIPAPLFLRRGLLKKRVAEIFQEATMSRRRLILSLAASAGLLVLAAAAAIWTFPLQVQAAVAPEDDPSPDRVKHVLEELRQALADTEATPEQRARWKRQLAELEASLSERELELRGEKPVLVRRGDTLERQFLELQKALEDPDLPEHQKVDLQKRFRELKAERAKQKPSSFQLYDPLVKDKC
jgi:beta-lactamase regulating signal transducer with metallopeptidase domain